MVRLVSWTPRDASLRAIALFMRVRLPFIADVKIERSRHGLDGIGFGAKLVRTDDCRHGQLDGGSM
jgi:hypothetical protein